MAIEIFILSGSRRGQRLTLDAQQFRAGCDPECEVRFDPQLEPAASERAAVFRLHGDGWYVHPDWGRRNLAEPQPGPETCPTAFRGHRADVGIGAGFFLHNRGSDGHHIAVDSPARGSAGCPVLPFQSPAPAANFPVVPPGANATFPVFPAAVTPAASPTGVTLAPSSVTTPAALPAVASWTGWPVIYTVAGVAICGTCCFLLAKFLFAPPPFVGPGPAASVVPPPVPSSVVSTTSPSAPLPIISPPVTSPPPPGTSAIAAPRGCNVSNHGVHADAAPAHNARLARTGRATQGRRADGPSLARHRADMATGDLLGRWRRRGADQPPLRPAIWQSFVRRSSESGLSIQAAARSTKFRLSACRPTTKCTPSGRLNDSSTICRFFGGPREVAEEVVAGVGQGAGGIGRRPAAGWFRFQPEGG